MYWQRWFLAYFIPNPPNFHWLQVDINLFQYFELPIIHFQLPISTAEGTLF